VSGDPRRPGGAVPRRVVGIGSVIALMLAAILMLGPGLLPPEEGTAGDNALPLPATGAPIRAEADVFRLRLDDLATGAEAERRPEAHPRTLAMHRALRAYPGAPPRIPHGLTGQEFRDGRCNVCHERGGYVARFAAYAPVTPHPELRECLQCHVADAALVGLDVPATPAMTDVCLQCHVLDRRPPEFVPLEWAPAAWPALAVRALPGSPPAIPHGSQLRENCLACHMGPGAVEEIRTGHPERANCRQCHVPAAEPAGAFTRPPPPRRQVTGGDA
jgi:nitrate reductase (cytochrome), electron transfer subunit